MAKYSLCCYMTIIMIELYDAYHVSCQEKFFPGASGMKVSREQAAKNRERILDAAAQLFRERGFEGIGVADLMNAAGLTHGGFYGHFSSKEDLIAQACARALERSHEKWTKRAQRAPDEALSSIARDYLSTRHRDDPGTGCFLAALGSEAARHGPGVRRTVSGSTALVVRGACPSVSGQLRGGEKAQGHRQSTRAGSAR